MVPYFRSIASVVLISMMLSSGADAFAVPRFAQLQTAGSTKTTTTTSLQLLPGQGKQLVAAFAASTAKHRKGDEKQKTVQSTVAIQDSATTAAAKHLSNARTFVSRVFSLPSSMIKRHPHPKIEGWADDMQQEYKRNGEVSEKNTDVVLYPIVGFRFFKYGTKGSYRVLPTKGNAACRIRNAKSEILQGWFSPACRLNMYTDNPCDKPDTH